MSTERDSRCMIVGAEGSGLMSGVGAKGSGLMSGLRGRNADGGLCGCSDVKDCHTEWTALSRLMLCGTYGTRQESPIAMESVDRNRNKNTCGREHKRGFGASLPC